MVGCSTGLRGDDDAMKARQTRVTNAIKKAYCNWIDFDAPNTEDSTSVKETAYVNTSLERSLHQIKAGDVRLAAQVVVNLPNL